MKFIKIPGEPASHDDYMRGYEDGVEYVLYLMETFINHAVVVGLEPEYIKAVEEMLEDVKITLDNE